MDAFLRAYKNKIFYIIMRFFTCFDVIGLSTFMLLVDFDPIRRLRLLSVIKFERNISFIPVNDLKSLFSNRLFGFRFDKSKMEIANDFPTLTNKTTINILSYRFCMNIFYLLKYGRCKFWRNKSFRPSFSNKMYCRRNKINKSASIVVAF